MASRSPIKPSPYEDSELLAVVGDVAAHPEIADAVALTQPLFDNNREPAGHPAAPTGKRIAARLRASWHEVCASALNPKSSASRFAGTRRGSDERPCSLDEAATALKLVALRRGVTMVSQRLYIEERKTVMAEDALRWRHGRKVWLPTVGQMLRGRTWHEIEIAAGLDNSAKTPRTTRTEDPFEQLVDLLELALETKGALPGSADLEAFARATGRRHPRRVKAFDEYIRALRQRRATRGLWTPSATLPRQERPDFTDVPAELVLAGVRIKDVWSRDECVQAVALAIGEAKDELTLRVYQGLANGRPEYPPARVFEKLGGFAAIRGEAHALRRERLSAARRESGRHAVP